MSRCVVLCLFLLLSLIQPSLEKSLGFVEGLSGRLPCSRLVLRGASLNDQQHPRLGSTYAIQKKHFNTTEPAEEENQFILNRMVRAVKHALGHDDSSPTLLGSSGLRVLHDELVPDQDQLPNGGKSETIEMIQGAIHDTVEKMQDPEKAAEETGGWVLLGSRRVGWAVQKLQGIPEMMFGGGGREQGGGG